MTTEPAWVEANPATSEPNTSGPADDDYFLQLLSQLLVSDRPLSEVLEETKQLARNLSKPLANTEAEPSRPAAIEQRAVDAVLPAHEMDVIERLRAAIAARVEREEKRRLRFVRLWRR
jgi:hypothetical protein